MNYQIKSINYRDPAMRREIRQISRKEAPGKRWLDWLSVVGQIMAILLGVAMLLLAVMFSIGNLFLNAEGGNLIGAVLWVGALILVLLCFAIRRRFNPIRENLWPAEADVVTVSFLEDGFQVEEPRVTSRLEYVTIRRVYETQSCFYLFVMKEHFLMLRKRDFTQGDGQTFLGFLEEKRGQKLEIR